MIIESQAVGPFFKNGYVVGCEETERVFAAAREPKRFWLIENSEHARGWQFAGAEYERRVTDFFRETLAAEAIPAQYGAAS